MTEVSQVTPEQIIEGIVDPKYVDPLAWVRLGKTDFYIRREIVELNCQLVGRATVMARYWAR